MNEKTIVRFTAAERLFHWVYFVAFAVLAVTGGFLYIPWLAFTMGEAGETNRLLHRIFAVVLILAAVLPLAFSPRAFFKDLREAFTWRAEDFTSLRILFTRYYWTGSKTGLPQQGKFTAGQKLNIVMQIVGFAVLAVTGILAWIGPGILSAGVLRWSLLLHGLAAAAATCFVLVHIYMVTILPMTRSVIASMFLGTMSEEYAREHHTRWYEEVARRRAGPSAPGGR